MIEHLQTIQKIHQLVWSYRQKPELAAVWPTPSPKASLRFAVTEAAEALDAEYLRGGEFARNHARLANTKAELADVAIMLSTALGPVLPDVPHHWVAVSFPRTLDLLCSQVAGANLAVTGDGPIDQPWTQQLILVALDITVHLFGTGERATKDALVYVEDKLNRTYHKFVVQ